MKYLAAMYVVLVLSGCAIKSPMVASPTGDGKYWVLKEPMIYQHPDTKEIVEIPRGFVTDFASVPRIFWSAFPPCDKYTSSAVLHDYLYWLQSEYCDRKCADEVLLLAMEEAEVRKTTRDAIYFAVRVGGESSWKSNAELKASGTIRIIPEKYMDFGPYETWEEIEIKIQNDNES